MEVNVLGYGLMGKQIASLLSLLGLQVNVLTRTIPDDALIYKQNRLNSKLLGLENRGGSISFASSISQLSPSALTIETVQEDLALKQRMYSDATESLTGEYYSNTSSFDPLEIGEFAGGLHFFNPINIRLVEYLVGGNKTHRQLKELLNILDSDGFSLLEVKANRGYLANAILFREISNVLCMVEKFGYSPQNLDLIYKKLYKDRAIFELIDLIGVDITLSIIKNLKESDDSVYLPKSLQYAIKNSILGKKNKTSFESFLKEIQADDKCEK